MLVTTGNHVALETTDNHWKHRVTLVTRVTTYSLPLDTFYYQLNRVIVVRDHHARVTVRNGAYSVALVNRGTMW